MLFSFFRKPKRASALDLGWRYGVASKWYFLYVYWKSSKLIYTRFLFAATARIGAQCAKVVINKISIKMIMYANSSRSTSLLLLLVVINNYVHTHSHTHTCRARSGSIGLLLKMDDAVLLQSAYKSALHSPTSLVHSRSGQCNGAHVQLHMIQITNLIFCKRLSLFWINNF